MPYTIREEKQYNELPEVVRNAALGAVTGLEGKILRQDPDNGRIEASFDKKILGNLLGDRTRMTVEIRPTGDGHCTVALEAHPIDAVGRKLMFGARKGVTRTVVTWYVAHLEHRLKPR